MDVIFDIDGTLANLDHRLHYVKSKPKNWNAFFAGIEHDEPCEEIVEILWALMNITLAPNDPTSMFRHRIIICSGRGEEYREPTEKWLAHHSIQYNVLYMRPAGDSREDSIIKKELLEEMRKDGFNPVLAIDDRKRVVDMWRREGLLCLQCAEGDF